MVLLNCDGNKRVCLQALESNEEEEEKVKEKEEEACTLIKSRAESRSTTLPFPSLHSLFQGSEQEVWDGVAWE
ncbi:hypothetical protein M0802_015305 [Mischocyttarus mexicanus]|nr:hypothetical protein M0802_015305 [Mischocyttarus mexicanus]